MVNAYNLIRSKEYRNLEIYVKLGFRFNLFDINQDLPKDFGLLSDAMVFCLKGNNNKLFDLNPTDLLYENEKGYTPLSFAVITDNIEAVKYLHTKVQNLNQKNSKNENLLHLATKYKSHKSLIYLLKNISLKYLNVKNDQGFSPLLLASSRNDYKAINIISELINKKQVLTTNKFGANILHWLSFNNIKDIYKIDFLKFVNNNELNNSKYLHNNAININPKDWLSINDSKLSLMGLH